MATQRTSEAPSWHVMAVAEALQQVSSSEAGLADDEAQRRLREHGPNELPEPPARALWKVFFAQLASPLILLLFGAAAIALALGHRSDAVVIAVVVIINSVVGTVQEGRAERSLRALRKLATHQARLVRGGHELLLAARELVVGDILLLSAGDAVAADARLLESAGLFVAEAALTGESVPVAKDPAPLAPEVLLADRSNMLYASTHVTAGRARAVVVATGMGTEIGAIAALAAAAEDARTPLEQRVAAFGRQVIYGAFGLFGLLMLIGWLRQVPLGDMLMIGISQVVGLVPEGLPVAMTIALAVGVQRMARRKTVVRRLSAVETLGSTTVICSDKTGTLTRNEMTVTALYLAGGRELSVTGVGYDPRGRIVEGKAELDATREPDVRALLEAAVLCNDAQLEVGADGAAGPSVLGDPTEVALLTLALKAGVVPSELRERFPRQAELPFDAARQMMATQHASERGSRVMIKGAPEIVLGLCGAARRAGGAEALSEADRQSWREAALAMAGRALRVLAVAELEGVELRADLELAELTGRATLLGLVGQIDPPRPEVKDAVARCRAAGIRPVMVTGDHKATGVAIARELGIALPDDLAVDGTELTRWSDGELDTHIDRISVFARVQPAQKLRIVGAYQGRGQVVAMTGDGVNDAPALSKANVGVAMGITGTEVAKEAAKVVIADDNFATLVAAVEEGRVVYRNIKKTVLLLFSTSLAEVLVLMLAMLLGFPPPFAAVQILWNNLVTEGAITVNLVMEPAEGDEMQQPPIATDEPLLTRSMLTRLVLMAIAIAASTLGWFIYRTTVGVPAAQVQTETFTLLAVCEWFNVLSCRSARESVFRMGLLRNPWLLGGLLVGNLLQLAVVFWRPLGEVFHTVPIGLREIFALGVVGSVVLWVEELRKLWLRRAQSLHRSP